MQAGRGLADQYSYKSMKNNRLLISAIIFSAAWHVFWLSAFTVVVVPKAVKPVKFSGVSFLGPILDRGAMKVSVMPHERSFLEKRYVADIDILLPVMSKKCAQDNYTEERLGGSQVLSGEDAFTGLLIPAIDSVKMEPPRDFD